MNVTTSSLSLRTSLGRFRVVALAEGWSFIVLLGVAMPLKYLMDFPLVVRVVGPLHGGLFVAFVATLMSVAAERQWQPRRIATAFVASLLPFGTLILDRTLARESTSSPG